jgi:hypothetical protein
MANNNRLGSDTALDFDRYVVGFAQGVSVNATGNAVATIPIMSGGLTDTTGCYIVRSVTVMNANKSINTANVIILTSSDGNNSNNVSNATVLSNVTAATTRYQDLTLGASAATTAFTAPALFVKVNTAVSGGTCDIRVIGMLVNA